MPTQAAVSRAPTLELPGLGCWSDFLEEVTSLAPEVMQCHLLRMCSSHATLQGWLCVSLLFLLQASPTFSKNSFCCLSLFFISKDQQGQSFLFSQVLQHSPMKSIWIAQCYLRNQDNANTLSPKHIFHRNVWKIVSGFWIFQIWE